VEEHQPLHHYSWRTLSKSPLPSEATPIRSKQSCLTKSSTSRTLDSSSKLPESSISISTETPITPTISGTSISKEEVSQLPEDIITNISETITKVVQQEVDPQLEVAQQEINSELESVKPKVNPEPIIVQTKVTFEHKVVQEPLSETVVLLLEHMGFEFEHSKVVTLLEDDQPVNPQTSVTIETSTLSTPEVYYRPDGEVLPPGLISIEE